MNEKMLAALQLIIARSPNAAEEALRTLAAARNNSPVLQIRYNVLLIRAFADPNAAFSNDERALLASAIEAPETDSRDFMLRVRLTDAERANLESASAAAGLSMSEFTRQKLFTD
jgi:hypothetical protein